MEKEKELKAKLLQKVYEFQQINDEMEILKNKYAKAKKEYEELLKEYQSITKG